MCDSWLLKLPFGCSRQLGARGAAPEAPELRTARAGQAQVLTPGSGAENQGSCLEKSLPNQPISHMRRPARRPEEQHLGGKEWDW